MARQVHDGIPGNAAVGGNPRAGNPQSLPIWRAEVKSSEPGVVGQFRHSPKLRIQTAVSLQFGRHSFARPRMSLANPPAHPRWRLT